MDWGDLKKRQGERETSRLGREGNPWERELCQGPKGKQEGPAGAWRRAEEARAGSPRAPHQCPQGLLPRSTASESPQHLRAHVHETELLTKCLHFYSSVEGKNLHSFFARAAVTKCYRPSSCNEMASQLWRLDLTLGWWQASPPGTGGLQAISDRKSVV